MAYKKSKKIDPLKEGKIVENNWARYVRARDAGHLDYIKTAIKCDRYYRGEQWAQEDIDALDSEDENSEGILVPEKVFLILLMPVL